MSSLYLFVEIAVKSGKLSGFIEKIESHASHVREEDGCEDLTLFYDTNSQERICVWEIWRDRASWDVHMANSRSKSWSLVAKDFVDGEKITVLRKI